MNELPIDKLGPYPLLQLTAAIVVLIGIAVAVYRGTRDRAPKSPPLSISNEQRYYFDGPVGEHLKLMRDTRNLLNEIKEHVEPLGELGRNNNRELGEISHKIDDLKEIKSARRR